MTVQTSQNLYGIGIGSAPNSGNVPVHRDVRDPASTDVKYAVDTMWVNSVSNNVWFLASFSTSGGVVSANWVQAASGVGGAIDELTTQDSNVVKPVSGNVNLSGVSGQLTTTGSGNTASIGYSSPSTTPAALTVTGLLTGNAGLTTSGGNITINSSGNTIQMGTELLGETILIGNSAANKLVTVGSTNGTSSLTLQYGTGGGSLDGSATANLTIAPSATSANLNIGGTGSATGNVVIAGGTGAQNIAIGNSTGGKTINIGTGAGANGVTVGSTNGISSTTIQAGTGSLILTTGSNGLISVVPATTTTSTGSVTLNARLGAITGTGFTTASGSELVITLSNSFITTSSSIMANVSQIGAAAGYFFYVQGIQITSAGNAAITLFNAGTVAIASNFILTFWVLN